MKLKSTTCKCCGVSLQYNADDNFVVCYKCGSTNQIKNEVCADIKSTKKEHVTNHKTKKGTRKSKLLNVLSACMVGVIALLVGVQAVMSGLNSDAVAFVESETEEVEDGGVNESESVNVNASTGIKYSKDTLLDAWNFACGYLTGEQKETYYGRQSNMTGSLVISASGLPSGLIPTQTFKTTTKMDSSKNIYQYTESRGYTTVISEVYANKSSDTIWSIYDGEKEKRTYAEYASIEGNTPDNYPIIVNNNTIIASTVDFKISNGYYKYTFEVDPQLATVGYTNKIKKSGASFTDGSAPVFQKVEIEVLINAKGYFYQISRKEVYAMNAKVAVYKGTATCTASYTETFDKNYNDAYIAVNDIKPTWLW